MLLEYLTNFKILSNRRDLNNLKIFSNLKLLFNNVIDGRMDNKSIIAIGVSGWPERLKIWEAKKFYDSKAWQTKRIEILKRDRFECQDCRARIQKAVAEGKWLPEKEKKIARAEQVHHIQALKEHPELALDNDNLISLCVRCHNIRHGRVPHKFKRKKKLASRERW